ncbi:unnamed protein product [Cyclocybe aegerita]|uniref:Uncharacterized protein n=1 Tax=Cyclocybe aegerita TaxID=1973307 RepID=A0A8S0W456_CYCAE|nr:unnamed protein product [Cyclocybe aegerita]
MASSNINLLARPVQLALGWEKCIRRIFSQARVSQDEKVESYAAEYTCISRDLLTIMPELKEGQYPVTLFMDLQGGPVVGMGFYNFQPSVHFHKMQLPLHKQEELQRQVPEVPVNIPYPVRDDGSVMYPPSFNFDFGSFLPLASNDGQPIATAESAAQAPMSTTGPGGDNPTTAPPPASDASVPGSTPVVGPALTVVPTLAPAPAAITAPNPPIAPSSTLGHTPTPAPTLPTIVLPVQPALPTRVVQTTWPYKKSTTAASQTSCTPIVDLEGQNIDKSSPKKQSCVPTSKAIIVNSDAELSPNTLPWNSQPENGAQDIAHAINSVMATSSSPQQSSGKCSNCATALLACVHAPGEGRKPCKWCMEGGYRCSFVDCTCCIYHRIACIPSSKTICEPCNQAKEKCSHVPDKPMRTKAAPEGTKSRPEEAEAMALADDKDKPLAKATKPYSLREAIKQKIAALIESLEQLKTYFKAYTDEQDTLCETLSHLVNTNQQTSLEVKTSFQAIVDAFTTHTERLQELSKTVARFNNATESASMDALATGGLPEQNPGALYQSDFLDTGDFYPQADMLQQVHGEFTLAMQMTVDPQALVMQQQPEQQFNFPSMNTLPQHQTTAPSTSYTQNSSQVDTFMCLVIPADLNMNMHPQHLVQCPSSMPGGMPTTSNFGPVNIERPRSGPAMQVHSQVKKRLADELQQLMMKRGRIG